MSEINGPNFNIGNVNFNSNQKQNQDELPEIIEGEEPRFKDFSDPKAEALGRSMLIKDVDNVNNDLRAIIKNPQILDNSDKMFDKAYKVAQETGLENPYEEAATFSTSHIS